ncbi:MAG: putative oxidoreductase YceM [Verrucomicrobiae bacterium]|nr:putative oxidoreductase YceM [Verrucomicrobiae bacterium]
MRTTAETPTTTVRYSAPYPMTTMKTPLKVGMIGVGNHARQVLIPALEQLPGDLRLVALATAHEETARTAGEFYRLPCYVGADRLIADPNVEAVIIASTGDHEPLACAALQAGKPVFNETPAIHSEAGAERIRQLATEKKLTYLVGSCLRYAPVYQKLRALLHQWRAEEPGSRVFNASYYFGGGHFQNLLLYLAGPVDSVLLTATEGSGSITLLRFANGDLGSIRDCGFRNWSPPYERVEIVHPSGLLIAEDGRAIQFHRTPRSLQPMKMSFTDAGGELFHTTFSLPYGQIQQLHLRGYIPELKEFADCVRTGAIPTCGVADALATLRVGAAARQSREAGGQWVTVRRD